MAFGKKKEERLEPMCGYPNEQIKLVKECLVGQRLYKEIQFDWNKIKKIDIDQILLTSDGPNSLIMTIHNESSNYTKAWKMGLGKFIFKDFRFQRNLDKYHFIEINCDGKNLLAFIRHIVWEDLGSEDTIETLTEYNAISFSYHDENDKEQYYQVLKIVEMDSDLETESLLCKYSPILNIDDPYQDNYNELQKQNDEIPETEEPILVSENSLTEDYINQISLF